ncbi:unnamed protein product [Rotaria magnacalcarata]|uniref:Uncharacterized protein n=1 Tax=Rotaria magnacalcarata TaxID=392030 RepID=A0A816S2W5_9BILA|nr:unnamed protein product [Rotaria magnacalcarata]
MASSSTYFAQKDNKACCNPLGLHDKIRRIKGLRSFSEARCSVLKNICNLKPLSKLCSICYKEVLKREKAIQVVSDSDTEASDCTSTNANAIATDTDEDLVCLSPIKEDDLNVINRSIEMIGVSPFVKRKLSQKKYPQEKLKSIVTSVAKKLKYNDNLETDDIEIRINDEPRTSAIERERANDFNHIISQLKDKFHISTKVSEKIQILTVLPIDWPIRKVQNEFGTSFNMARVAKNLQKEKGILSCPNAKVGKTVSLETAEIVRNFYMREDISRTLSGLKDCVSVKNDKGEREHKQKHLILCNLKEVYAIFKAQNPEYKIGFSKFAELRPKQCILAGSSGTHAVCVCTLHQNTKLMMEGARFQYLTQNDDVQLKHYRHVLSKLTCNPPCIECYFRQCKICKDSAEKLKDFLRNIFEDYVIDQIEYRKWTSTDRSTLETIIENTEDFVTTFGGQVERLLRHDFIAKIQMSFMQDLRDNHLKEGEFLVIGDFAENYTFIIQDEVQSFHWNNISTVQP